MREPSACSAAASIPPPASASPGARLRVLRALLRLRPAASHRTRSGGARGRELSASREHLVVPRSICACSAASALTADIAVPKDASMTSAGHPDHLRSRAQHHLSFLRAGLGRGAGSVRHLHRRQRDRLFRLSGLPSRVHRTPSSTWPTSRRRPAWKAARSIQIHTPLIALDQGRDRRSWRGTRRRLRSDP